ncbi:hypothetical protein QCA50_010536 [Cerrena zonata]|uniref:Uncharacterized protein n=1 Tax=Cerrena zonata TaxID=2478898 RepID=A0AAW0G472_9APHY
MSRKEYSCDSSILANGELEQVYHGPEHKPLQGIYRWRKGTAGLRRAESDPSSWPHRRKAENGTYKTFLPINQVLSLILSLSHGGFFRAPLVHAGIPAVPK